MRINTNQIVFSATDLANHLACNQLTQLNLKVVKGEIKKDYYSDPIMEILRQRGLQHEASYVEHLRNKGYQVMDLTDGDPERKPTLEETVQAMQKGYDVIVQARLENHHWGGYADILVKREGTSSWGDYHYEVQDTKLSQATRAGAILQLCLYSDLLDAIQQRKPEYFYVIKPGEHTTGEEASFKEDEYRLDDFKYYYHVVKERLLADIKTKPDTYPLPVEHCNICSWWQHCATQRKTDNHLSLVAGLRTSQIKELNKQNIFKLAEFAEAITIQRPERGTLESLQTRQEQAKIQHKGEREFKMLDLDPKKEKGLYLLPEPSEGDIYFDFEGDAFHENGNLDYLFGYVYKKDGEWVYEKKWATNRKEEKEVFEEFMAFVYDRLIDYPELCIYHFAPYEKTNLQRLMHVHGVCGDEVNNLLRGKRLIDLRTVIRQSLIASVESYGLKELERFPNYTRQLELRLAGAARRIVEHALQLKLFNTLPAETIKQVEDYNEDDCRATKALHDWIENLRKTEFLNGENLERLQISLGNEQEPDDENTKGEERAALIQQLQAKLPQDETEWTNEHHAIKLLSNMLDYFERERQAGWWEYYATKNYTNKQDLEDAGSALCDLSPIEEVPGRPGDRTPTLRYSFPAQEFSIKIKANLEGINEKKFGTVVNFSLEDCTIDIKKRKDSIDYHPVNVQVVPDDYGDTLQNSLFAFAKEVVDNGLGSDNPYQAACQLLLKKAPRLSNPVNGSLIKEGQDHVEAAIELTLILDNSNLAIQGPPGTGKSYTGAEIICALVTAGKKVGITANSHKVIRALLQKAKKHAEEKGIAVGFVRQQDGNDIEEDDDGIEVLAIDGLLNALEEGKVVGGTSYLWANNKSVNTIDYLIVDEAGQLSLANTLAAARAAKNLILLGDPRQLKQPQKASHPDGSEVSALDHLLGDHKTIPEDMGVFIKQTRRLHPDICSFISEQFYEGRLTSTEQTNANIITGSTPFSGSGLFYVPVEHEGNQNHAIEEVKVIESIVKKLMKNAFWQGKKLNPEDFRIVAPYNAQVNRLRTTLPDFKIGTVDLFQGQEAPVVIYSMTTSSSEEAPRGMDFLYSPNRFNVAVSRALSICIVVGSPKVFEPDCKRVDQMNWANAFCRYKQLAKTITEYV